MPTPAAEPGAPAARSRRLPFVLAGAVWLLGGCASLVTPNAAPSAVAVPAAWSGAAGMPVAGEATLAQWWLRLDDPMLAALVSRALQANTSVTGAQAALRQSRALRDVAAAGLLPVLGSSASAQRNGGGGNSSNSFRAGLDASWELDVFGERRSAVDASAASARASAAGLGDVMVSVAAEVALDYITLRSAQERLAIAASNLALQQETLQITRWREQAGLVTALEVEQARAASEQTQAQLPALQTSIDQTSHALAVLTGQPPAALLAELAPPGPLPQAPGNLALALPADTLRQRSDVRAAEYQVQAAFARVAQADAARLPSFKLGGSVGLNALTLGALTNGAALAGALLASVSLPIFDGGAMRAQVQAQQAALVQAQVAYQATVLGALKEVEDALVALRGDRERVLRLQNAAGAAASAALMARQRYSSGLVDFQTVLETQRTELGTQDNVASARAAVSADHVRLYKALGGGWRPEPGDASRSAPEHVSMTPLP